jgi:hypothetical protein
VLVAGSEAPYLRRFTIYGQREAADTPARELRGLAAITSSQERIHLMAGKNIQQEKGRMQYPELAALRGRARPAPVTTGERPPLDARWETVVRSRSVAELVRLLQAYRYQDKIYGEYERLVAGLGALLFRERGPRPALEFHMRLNSARVASGDEPIPYDLGSYARRLPRAGEGGPEGDGPGAA